jgi:hypothetical protein
MKNRLWQVLFSESSLLKQSYVWFWFSLVCLVGFFLPQWILVKFVYVLSCLALTISAQTFIAGAQGNQKLVDMDKSIVDKIVEDERIPTDSS